VWLCLANQKGATRLLKKFDSSDFEGRVKRRGMSEITTWRGKKGVGTTEGAKTGSMLLGWRDQEYNRKKSYKYNTGR